MKTSLLLKLVGIVAFIFAFPAFAQDTTEDPAPADEEVVEEEAPAPGIIFLKPPERPLLGSVTKPATATTLPTTTTSLPTTTQPRLSGLTEEVLSSISNPELVTFLRALNLNVAEFGLGAQYKFTMQGTNVNLPSSLQSNMQLNPIIFGTIDSLDMAGGVTLERDFSVEEVQSNSIIYNQITIENIALEWGGIAFSGSGLVDVDFSGMLSGELKLTVTSWNDDVNLSNFIKGAQATEIEILLSVLTSGDALTLPVTFDKGTAKIGQMTIGKLPSIYQ